MSSNTLTKTGSNGHMTPQNSPLPANKPATLARQLVVTIGTTSLAGGDKLAEVLVMCLGSVDQAPHVAVVAIDTAEMNASYLPDACQLRLIPASQDELERCRKVSEAIQFHVDESLDMGTASTSGCGADPNSGWVTGVLRGTQLKEKLREAIARLADPGLADRLRAGAFDGLKLEEDVLHVHLLLGIAGATGGPLGIIAAALIPHLAAEYGMKTVVHAYLITSSAYKGGSQVNQQTRDRNTAYILSLFQDLRSGRPITLKLPGCDPIHTTLALETVTLLGGTRPVEAELQQWAEGLYYSTTTELGERERGRILDPKKNVSQRLDPEGNPCNLGTCSTKTLRAVSHEASQRVPLLVLRGAVRKEVGAARGARAEKAAAHAAQLLAQARLDPRTFQSDLPPRPIVGAFSADIEQPGVEARRSSLMATIDHTQAIAALRSRTDDFAKRLAAWLLGLPVCVQDRVLAEVVAEVERWSQQYPDVQQARAAEAELAQSDLKKALARRPKNEDRAEAIRAALQRFVDASGCTDGLHQACAVLRDLVRRLQERRDRVGARMATLRATADECDARIKAAAPTCSESALLSNHDLARLIPLGSLRTLCRQVGDGTAEGDVIRALRQRAQALTGRAIQRYGSSFLAAWHVRPGRDLMKFVRAHLGLLPRGVILKSGAEGVLPFWDISLVGLPEALYRELGAASAGSGDLFFAAIRENDRMVLKQWTVGISAAWLQDAEEFDDALRRHCLADPNAMGFSITPGSPVPLFRRLPPSEQAELELLGLLMSAPGHPICLKRETLVYCAPDGTKIVVAKRDEEWTAAWHRGLQEPRLPGLDALKEHYDQLVESLSRDKEVERVRRFLEDRLRGATGRGLWTGLRLATALSGWLTRMSQCRRQNRIAFEEDEVQS